MGKVVLFTKKAEKIEPGKAPTPKAKLSHATLYIYHSNLLMCEKLFLVKPGEFPPVEELENMQTGEARRYIRKLSKIFQEKAEERHIKLTGKTMARAAVDRMDEWLKALLK